MTLPTSEVELFISCRELIVKDVLSKSDPMCVTFIRQFGEDKWIEYHRTECLENIKDPKFAKSLQMTYRFEEQQPLRFEVYDCDSSSTFLGDHDFIGSVTCQLAQIISYGKIEMKLEPRDKSVTTTPGFIQISVEELPSIKDEVTMKIRGEDLDKKNWFWKSDPFLEIFKASENAGYLLVYRTEAIKNTLSPEWKEFSIPARKLCNGDHFRTLKFLCYDWNSSGDHVLIGEFSTDLKTIMEKSPSCFKLMKSKKQTKSGYKGSGDIIFEKCTLKPINTFVDYIMGGTQLFCTFAIDFTGSNGDPRNRESLHYINDTNMNLYEQAIMSVGNIIENYDSDKQFPVLGFGAQLPGGQVSHEFFVNMNPATPYCDRVNGVLQVYRNFISLVISGTAQLYGPTNFSPVINHVAKYASTYTDGSSYFILLIITDGIITDMPQTCQAIVKASKLPMSIIIVGVGSADFSAMEQLDGDTVALTAGGEKAARDIVQFVPFSKFVGGSLPWGDLLAREVLAEIPDQFLSYMKINNIPPKPKSTTLYPGFVQFFKPGA
ncbi:copine-8 [Halyomorpha halys]|uniref:copine-8 n=1 Tax=Halyomorpha halys TaxID=286706 RepID=UPI0006D4F5E9|nr:copine-8 [Halyomorpha halys]